MAKAFWELRGYVRFTVLSGAILLLSENDRSPSLYQKKFIVDFCVYVHTRISLHRDSF